jgi:peptide/nickel transport system permease protein
MINYIMRRLLQGLIVLVLVSIFIFFVMRLLPGDPLTLYISQRDMQDISAEDMAKLRAEYDLDKPAIVQYVYWVGNILHGDLGKSIFFKNEVIDLIKERMPVTIHLGLISLVLSGTLGVVFGTICALKRGKWPDTTFTILANIGITLPAFWIGILLIYVFSLTLGWLPVQGYTSPFDDFGLSVRKTIMPIFCLSLFSIASVTRQMRSSMLEVTRQDYLRTAYAKGLPERVIIIRHTLKNALIPVITVLGMHIGSIFGGAVLIETVFNVPGVGRLMRDAVFSHDYQVVQAGVLIIALVVVLSNLIVDISYGWFDPRIRYE